MTSKANPVPSLVISSSDDTTYALWKIRQWSKQISPVLFQAFDAPAGILPVPSAPSNNYLIQTGTPAISFSSGVGSYTFENGFPNGVLSIQATVYGLDAGHVVSVTSASITGLSLSCFNAGSSFTGTANISLYVVGW